MTQARRRVAVLTGSRADYGLLRSTMSAVATHPRLKLQVIVTGMHLLRKFGHTVDEVVRDGWPIDARVRMQAGDDSPLDQANGLSRGIAGIADALQRLRSDVVVVLGDRIEAMAGALAAVTTGRWLAHVHGGDVAPGDLDDALRHSITKLTHLHFAATRSAARRIIRMGESPDCVFHDGAPGLDELREFINGRRREFVAPTAQRRRVARPLANGRSRGLTLDTSRQGEQSAARGTDQGVTWNPTHRAEQRTALIVQHPCGRSPETERRVMAALLRAVRDHDLAAVGIHPNSDRGHSGIVAALAAHSRRVRRRPGFRSVRSLNRDDYLRLLIESDVIVGNSSSGIIEAATAGIPAVNVGPRQRGRETSGNAVVHADETYSAIRVAIGLALRLRLKPGTAGVYGDGSAGRRIAEVIAGFALTDQRRRKTITY